MYVFIYLQSVFRFFVGDSSEFIGSVCGSVSEIAAVYTRTDGLAVCVDLLLGAVPKFSGCVAELLISDLALRAFSLDKLGLKYAAETVPDAQIFAVECLCVLFL